MSTKERPISIEEAAIELDSTAAELYPLGGTIRHKAWRIRRHLYDLEGRLMRSPVDVPDHIWERLEQQIEDAEEVVEKGARAREGGIPD